MKRDVYICDTEGCGAVLLEPEDGFVLRGALLDSGATGNQQVVLGSTSGDDDDTALCRGCLLNTLDSHKEPTEVPPR
jgi:2-methylcitrate dehydratase PrpD